MQHTRSHDWLIDSSLLASISFSFYLSLLGAASEMRIAAAHVISCGIFFMCAPHSANSRFLSWECVFILYVLWLAVYVRRWRRLIRVN